jgi:hypothetical protein
MPKSKPAPRPPARRPAPSPLVGSARSILRGELDRVGLPTLLTIMEMERRSGLLVLSRPRQIGRLHVRDGQVIRATVEDRRERDQPGQQGVEAAYQMLTWPDGQFELWHADVDRFDEIQIRTTYLLMEGMRRLDEGVHAGGLSVRGPVDEPLDVTDEVTEVTEVSDITGEGVAAPGGRPAQQGRSAHPAHPAQPAQPANDFFVAW